MKKFLIAVFMMMILSFGIIGFTQTTNNSDEQIDEDEPNSSITIES